MEIVSLKLISYKHLNDLTAGGTFLPLSADPQLSSLLILLVVPNTWEMARALRLTQSCSLDICLLPTVLNFCLFRDLTWCWTTEIRQYTHNWIPSPRILDWLFKNWEQQSPTESDGKMWHRRTQRQSKDDDDEWWKVSNEWYRTKSHKIVPHV